MYKLAQFATAAALLSASFCAGRSAFAWDLDTPHTEAAARTDAATYPWASGEIYANPEDVYLPPNTAGHTRITWKWNKLRNDAHAYACVYVVVDDSNTASVVQCEHQDNYYNTDISWIAAPHTYNFVLSVYVGDSVPTESLQQLTYKLYTARSNVIVTWVVTSPSGNATELTPSDFSAND